MKAKEKVNEELKSICKTRTNSQKEKRHNALNKLNSTNGITLIALVVTIVILIILATISISALFGENGLIKKAQEAKDHQSNAVAMEEGEMDKLAEEYANIIASEGNGGSTPTEPEVPEITPDTPVGTEVKAPATWTSTKVTPISDGSGNAIPLPDGFYYVGGDRNSGLVISDKQNDTMDAAFPNSGNQFVWIPVDSETDLTRTNFDSSGQPTTGLSADYVEPYSKGYSDGNGTQEAADFNTMKEQVLKYGGFYIGRYEAGDKTNGITLRTKVTTDHEVVVQKGVAPYNYIPWGQSMSDVDTAFAPSDYNSDNVTTHGVVYLSKHMYDGKEQAESVTTTLCYSSQWDAMCRYIGDNNRTTPEKDAPELTGNVSTDVSKNIYDLAGNCREWTFEANYSNYRVGRGGSYYYDYSVSNRGNNYPDYTNDNYSFRPSLYVRD